MRPGSVDVTPSITLARPFSTCFWASQLASTSSAPDTDTSPNTCG